MNIRSLSFVFLFGGLAATFFTCGTSNEPACISGTIAGAEGKTVYLERYVNQRVVETDSAVVSDNGKFHLVPSPPLELNYYRLKLNDSDHIIVLTDSTVCIVIEGEAGDMQNAKAKCSANTELILEFRDTINAIDKRLSDMAVNLRNKELSDEELRQLKQRMSEVKKGKKDFALAFIKEHNNSPASFSALTELNQRTDLEVFESVLTNTEGSFGHSYQHKLLKQQVANQKQQAALGNKATESNNKYGVGMVAPDLKMKNPEGKEMSLYDLKGKVVLVDFWASWCGPCRRENPNVIKAYDKYNKDGFEVFSVSLDRSIDPWKRAIEQDGLKWPYHVSDLKGWKSDAAALYEIHSIPHTLLINRDGTIAGTHLRGPQLESKLAELFGH